MPSSKIPQRGFGAIEGFLVVVVVGIIAGVAWLMYRHYQAAIQTRSTSTVARSALENSTTTKTRATAQQPTTNRNVVKIPELGIQMTVPSDIKDLTYQVRTVTLRDGKQATLALFSTQSLTALDPNCDTSAGPLGSLERVDGQYPDFSNGQYDPLDYGELVKQLPTFFISAGAPNAPCSASASVSGTAAGFRGEFGAAEATIQQLS